MSDVTYCDWLCSNELCERNLYHLEGISKEELNQISIAQFADCPQYGSTSGMCVPMKQWEEVKDEQICRNR